MRILLVEDYDGFAKNAMAALDMFGFPITDRASSGPEAIELLTNTDYDAVVTDFEVPPPQGPTIARVALAYGIPLVVLWSSIPRYSDEVGKDLMEEDRFDVLEKSQILDLVNLLKETQEDLTRKES